MNARDEATQGRRRQGDLDGSHVTPEGSASGTLVLKTVSLGAYPTTAGVTFACHVMTIAAAETEGAAPSYTDTGQLVYAVHLGPTAPPVGTMVLGTQLEGYIVFD